VEHYLHTPFEFGPRLCNSNAPYLHLGQLVEALRYKPEVAGSIPDGVIEILR
jgi:hypothetical protein